MNQLIVIFAWEKELDDCGILMGNELQLAVPLSDDILEFREADTKFDFVTQFLILDKHTVEGFLGKTTIGTLQEDLGIAERIVADKDHDSVAIVR